MFTNVAESGPRKLTTTNHGTGAVGQNRQKGGALRPAQVRETFAPLIRAVVTGAATAGTSKALDWTGRLLQEAERGDRASVAAIGEAIGSLYYFDKSALEVTLGVVRGSTELSPVFREAVLESAQRYMAADSTGDSFSRLTPAKAKQAFAGLIAEALKAADDQHPGQVLRWARTLLDESLSGDKVSRKAIDEVVGNMYYFAPAMFDAAVAAVKSSRQFDPEFTKVVLERAGHYSGPRPGVAGASTGHDTAP